MQLGKWTFRATDTTHLYFSGLKRGESTHVTLGVVCQRGGWARARSRKPAQLMMKKVREWESKFTPLLFDITAPSLSALLSYFPDSPTRKSTRGTPKVKLERQPIMYISGGCVPLRFHGFLLTSHNPPFFGVRSCTAPNCFPNNGQQLPKVCMLCTREAKVGEGDFTTDTTPLEQRKKENRMAVFILSCWNGIIGRTHYSHSIPTCHSLSSSVGLCT